MKIGIGRGVPRRGVFNLVCASAGAIAAGAAARPAVAGSARLHVAVAPGLDLLLDGVRLRAAKARTVRSFDLPPGPHLVWTSDARAGHASLLLAPGEERSLRLG